MKSFLQFLSEAALTAGQQASRLGLVGDGHGGWYDKRGEFVAKTEKGKLKFYNKRQRVGQDPPQTDKEKKLSHSTSANQSPEEIEKKRRQDDDLAGAPLQKKGEGDQEKTSSDGDGKKKEGVLTVVFGRFNPPTIGHEKLLNTASSIAVDGNYIVVPSRTQDPKKNPLSPDQKISLMRKMFPDHSERIINDSKIKTIFDVLQKASIDGYQNIMIVGGSDRVAEFDKLANQYNNGDLYQFDSIESRSGGARDPDSDDVKGMSASKQRKAAAEGNFELFVKGVPASLSKKEKKELYNDIRSAMNIKEGWNLWEVAPKFDWKNLRENYIADKIYQIGQLVESLNTGLVGRIIRRGTNYLICVTEDNVMFKSWIKDVKESYTEKHMDRKERVAGKPNTLFGTSGYKKVVQDATPGSSWGKQFINKYRKYKY